MPPHNIPLRPSLNSITQGLLFSLRRSSLLALASLAALSAHASDKTQIKSISIDLSQVANMGYADPVANDQTGGWTDQGPGQDLSTLPIKDITFGEVTFQVIDPSQNNGKSCLVFQNKNRPYLLDQATIDLNGQTANYLYLLHAGAWVKGNTKAGTLAVNYEDGSTQSFTITNGVDNNDWWKVNAAENAAIAWPQEGAKNGGEASADWQAGDTNKMGLYASRFQVKPLPISSITLTHGDSIWMVVAITAVKGKDIAFDAHVEHPIPLEITPGKEWKTFRYSQAIKPGSALDFSFLNDGQPAGSHGRIIVKGDQFVAKDAPDTPIRFYGANVCVDAAVMTDNELAVLPDWAKMMGYNAIRLHHFDNEIVEPGPELKFDPVQLDRFFKTFAAFKERGMYVTLDLFVSRDRGFGDEEKMHSFRRKILIMFDPKMRNNLKEFVRILLTTVNPYTGLALKDDPAFFSSGLINENPLLEFYPLLSYPNNDSELHEIYKKSYEAWCAKNGVKPAFRPDPTDWSRFLIDVHNESYQDFQEFLTSIGVQVPLSNISSSTNLILSLPRANFDYTDIHWYYGHPRFENGAWEFPFSFDDASSISPEKWPLVIRWAANRILGQPIMVTEWHYCSPNRYRSEGGTVGGSLAALQDLNGIFDFSGLSYRRKWGDPTRQEPNVLGVFSLFADPISVLNGKIMALLFARGDVKPAPEVFALNVNDDIVSDPGALQYLNYSQREDAQPPNEFRELATVARIGVNVNGQNDADISWNMDDLRNGRAEHSDDAHWILNELGIYGDADDVIISSGGQIEFSPNELRYNVVTEMSEALVQQQKSNEGDALSIKNNTTFSNVFAGSIDEKPLRHSKHVLILHMTDVKASDIDLRTQQGKLYQYNWGKYPYLIRRGSVDISLANDAPGDIKLYALDMTGERVTTVPFTEDNGIITFTANTDMGEYTPMAYELVRE